METRLPMTKMTMKPGGSSENTGRRGPDVVNASGEVTTSNAPQEETKKKKKKKRKEARKRPRMQKVISRVDTEAVNPEKQQNGH